MVTKREKILEAALIEVVQAFDAPREGHINRDTILWPAVQRARKLVGIPNPARQNTLTDPCPSCDGWVIWEFGDLEGDCVNCGLPRVCRWPNSREGFLLYG